MAGTYGRTFAAELNEKGKHDEAIVEATAAMAREGDNPEHWFDRASAYVPLGRMAEAATDLERALELDREAGVLDGDEADDLYFSALLAAARTAPATSGQALLDGYLRTLPTGRHADEVASWKKRLTGELKSDWVKTHE